MSRIGKQPVVLPDKVKLTVTGRKVSVQGPQGQLAMDLPGDVEIKLEDKNVFVTRKHNSRQARSSHGLARALIQSMVTGVATGYKKELQIEGVGYRADMKGKELNLSMGFSHPVRFPIPGGIKVKVDKQTRVILEGADKALLGQIAADIRQVRPPEPYKGKGIRYVGEVVQRKAGKAAAGAGAAVGGSK